MAKFNPDTVDIIVEALRETGSRREAWESAGVSKVTFYAWMRQFPGFRREVEAAEEEYRRVAAVATAVGKTETVRERREHLRKVAWAKVADYLENGVEEIVKSEEVKLDADGNVVHRVLRRTTKNGAVPQWAIERFVEKPVNDVVLYRQLADSGLLPHEYVDALEGKLEEIADHLARVSGSVNARLAQTD